MKLINYDILLEKEQSKKSRTKTQAIYFYKKREKDGKVVIKKFVSNFISTIDIPYGNYILK